jgi:superfamily II DNA helicase RecQ
MSMDMDGAAATSTSTSTSSSTSTKTSTGTTSTESVEGRARLEAKFAEARRLARLDDGQQGLYGRLAGLRAGLAAEAGLPAYQILTNRQLLGLCEAPPRTVGEMAERHGISRVRLLAYGEALLGVILRRELSEEPPNAAPDAAGN